MLPKIEDLKCFEIQISFLESFGELANLSKGSNFTNLPFYSSLLRDRAASRTLKSSKFRSWKSYRKANEIGARSRRSTDHSPNSNSALDLSVQR